MQVKSKVAQGIAAIGLIAGVIAVGAGPTFADFGHGGHGAGRIHILYVSNLVGATVGGPGLVPASEPGLVGGPWSPQAANGCATAPYATIGAAVAAATPNTTIEVCPGTYAEDVVVPAAKPLTIVGVGGPIINAINQTNGVQVLASGSTIEGFTVAYATGEGILVGGVPGASGTISDVTISANRVLDNDRGNPTGVAITTSSYVQCNTSAAGPGDCGEGIHLLSADNSTVVDNYVTGNLGGILLTDENGPADGDLIASNTVLANAYDCGITVAGHQLGTTTNGTTWSTVLPSVGGVFDNTIRDNQASDNGVLGQGGGILLATGVPGGAVYDNNVEGNSVSGNGLGGITVHSHSPGENLNGNTIQDNVVGTNDLDGDPDFGGDVPPAIDPSTTGIIVATAVVPLSITIENNQIENDVYGIWMTPGVTAMTGPPVNTFTGVTTAIFTAP
jgi:parallel beta-helix repeat protein